MMQVKSWLHPSRSSSGVKRVTLTDQIFAYHQHFSGTSRPIMSSVRSLSYLSVQMRSIWVRELISIQLMNGWRLDSRFRSECQKSPPPMPVLTNILSVNSSILLSWHKHLIIRCVRVRSVGMTSWTTAHGHVCSMYVPAVYAWKRISLTSPDSWPTHIQ